jgi:hypothetical protein
MPFMACVYLSAAGILRLLLPNFYFLFRVVDDADSRPFTSKTKFEETSHTRINTHLQKCSEQRTPERPACSRLVTWSRNKTKEIFNKGCCWLFPSSTSFRAALSLWQTEKVSNSLKIYFQGFLSLKNKVIKQFRKTPLIKFRAVGKENPDFAFPPFMTWLISSLIS